MTHLHQRSKHLSRDLFRLASQVSEEASEKGVHRLRTTIRRMETLFNQAEPRPGKKQQRVFDELHALRKRAGKVRDLDIQLGLLGSIGNGSAAADRRVLAESLKKKRAKQATRLAAAAKKLEGSKLFSRLMRMTENLQPTQGDSSASLDPVRQELSRLATEYTSRQALKPARLHELRIKLKVLRYQSELAAETLEQKDLVEELKSVQDCIGEWHDWEMLAESAEKQFGNRMNCALLVEIRSLVAAKHSAANSAATNFLATYSPAAGKKPAAVQPTLAFAQRA